MLTTLYILVLPFSSKSLLVETGLELSPSPSLGKLQDGDCEEQPVLLLSKQISGATKATI